MRILLFRLLPAFLGAGICVLAQSPQTLIENDQVRVVRVTDQPHVKSQPHEHKVNRVMIYLQPGREDIISQDGKKTTLQWMAGEVKWSPASGVHTSEITSNSPVTIVEVEVKKAGGAANAGGTPLDPVKVDPKDYKVEFENNQVRIVRVRIPAKNQTPLHEHVLNRVVVYLTDQNSLITAPDGKTETAQHKAGEASWGGPAKHREQNRLDTPFEAIVVEFKG
jgi:uncharacterized RmlC-like cupin family protein